MNSFQEPWNRCLQLVGERLGSDALETWFHRVDLTSVDHDLVTLQVPNQFYKESIESRYADVLLGILREVFTLDPVRIEWDYHDDGTQTGADVLPVPTPEFKIELHPSPPRSADDAGLNRNYVFDTFVTGSSNQLAHAACRAVAEDPGRRYNPLFIYGGVGLGKTHLLNAIGNSILATRPDLTILAIPVQRFVEEVVYSVRHDKMAQFHQRYRNLDILLVDDIQFIQGKERTQEEFFHLFNTLHQFQKQIVISSDRFPNEIRSIADRLRSRFSWGLIADIQPPDFETKLAILRKKAEAQNINLPADVSDYIAASIRSNIRDLEGALLRLAAASSLGGRPLTLETARDELRGLVSDQQRPITIETIQKVVAAYHGIKVFDMRSKRRTKDIAEPRQIAMYLAKQLTNLSLAEIGKGFGGKDHSTVIHACKKIADVMKSDEDLNRRVQILTQKVRGEQE